MNDLYKYTILEYYGENRSKTCGYCKEINSNVTYGMWAHSLHSMQYQNLIDRGWRRCGSYLYKPKMDVICCPLYTIRCDALEFKISKSQKKILKKVNKYLMNSEETKSNRLKEEMTVKEEKTVKPGVGADPNKPQCKKAKLMRLERKLQRQKIDQINIVNPCPTSNPAKEKDNVTQESITFNLQEIPNRSPSNIDLNKPHHSNLFPQTESKIITFNSISTDGIHSLTFKLIRCNTKSKEFSSSLEESFEIYKKYQQIIHDDSVNELKYDRYLKFLVHNPLEETRMECPSTFEDYGSFHLQYILNGKIIGVSVLDILPYCISSVYFYYNPDYSFLNLGCLSALLEIQLVQQLNIQYPNIKHYYMGYYIHSNIKMRYKGAYKPSELLCPITSTWVPFDLACKKIEINKFSRLSDLNITDENADFMRNQINILKNRKILSLSQYIERYGTKLIPDIFQWAKFVGKLIIPDSILVL